MVNPAAETNDITCGVDFDRGHPTGYDRVNDAKRLRRGPVMRWRQGGAGSPSPASCFRMWQFSFAKNLSALVYLLGQ